DRSGPTKEIWFYQHPLPAGRTQYVKTRPLAFEEFSDLVAWWHDREVTSNSWLVPVADILQYDDDGTLRSCNLDVKNPVTPDQDDERSSADIVRDVYSRHERLGQLIAQLLEELSSDGD